MTVITYYSGLKLCYSELFEAQRWHTEPTLWTPMVVLDNGKHLFIGEIFEYTSMTRRCFGKVVRFTYMVKCMKL